MELWFEPGSLRFASFLLLAAALAFFAASRAAVDALAQNPHPHAGRLAIGHWLPIACAAIFALLMGHPSIALAIVFSTSVACLTLVLGVTAFVAPMNAPPGEGRAIWPFVLPATLLAMITGLSGTITAIHAGAMLILGVVLLPLVTHRNDHAIGALSALPLARVRGLSSVQLALAILLAGLGAWAAITAATQFDQASRFFSSVMIATLVIAPALMLPVLATSGGLAHCGQSSLTLSLCVLVVLLNLCLLLPAVALLWYVRPVLLSIDAGMNDAYAAITNLNPPIIYPLLTWRLDNILLLVLGVMLLPLSMGRATLGRYEGIGLLIAYGMYLLLTLVINVR